MGLFDFLTGGRGPSTLEMRDDRIWLTQAAKSAGILRDLEESAQSESVAVLLVAHFPETLTRLETFSAGWKGDVPVQAVLAENLSTDLATRLHVDESARIDLIVAERHPLPSVDDGLRQFAEDLSCRCRMAVHLSLDDPLLKPFVGDWLEKMLAQLGMKEDEAIESRMVARRIRAAQEKVAAQAMGNSPASSCEEWMAKNVPET